MARVLVTGSAQGIGAETARQLIAQGHDVVLHARNSARAAAAREAVSGQADVVIGELTSVAQTTHLAAAAAATGPFDAIIHNAGIGGGAPQRVLTEDGLEQIFQVNVVAPYVLSALIPLAPRMVYLTSGLESDGVWVPEDLQWASRQWHGMQAYSDSKMHVSMLAFELASRNPELAINVVDPGWIKTQMGGPNAVDEVETGAATQVWLATSADPAATGTGRYWKHLAELTPNPVTQDPAARAVLLAELERLTGVGLT